MARGRMIKPELWTSKRINRVSLESNLLFIAILNFCDDFGTIQDSNRMILGNCFPYRENITEKMIEKWKSELVEVQLLAKIEYQGRNLLAVVKWEKHQTIMNRSKRNNIDNNLENQDVIDTIESLISVSLGTNYPIDNRQVTNDKGKETSDKGKKLESKSSFGVKGLVKMTDAEYQKLCDTYGKTETDNKVIDFEAFKDFPKYKDHYLAINKWLRKDCVAIKQTQDEEIEFKEAL